MNAKTGVTLAIVGGEKKFKKKTALHLLLPRCVNTDPGFYCICEPGFIPTQDRQSCLDGRQGSCFTSVARDGQCRGKMPFQVGFSGFLMINFYFSAVKDGLLLQPDDGPGLGHRGSVSLFRVSLSKDGGVQAALPGGPRQHHQD